MKHAEQAAPNHALRQERELRGWSQKYVAEQIEAPNPSYISRWECGTASPSPYYREKLCRLFAKNAQELGLLQASTIALTPDSLNSEQTQTTATFQRPDQLPIFNEAGLHTREQTLSADPLPLPTQRALSPLEIPTSSYQSERITEGTETRKQRFQQHKGRKFLFKRPLLLGLALILLLGSISASMLLLHPQSQRSWPTFKYDPNITHPTVIVIQSFLRKVHGFYLGKYDIDGSFGPDTENAVRRFQEAHGLPSTGIVENQTWEALLVPSKRGDHGEAVSLLQHQLNLVNTKHPVKVTGIFSAPTQNSVTQVQLARKLQKTGAADLNTWCVLVGGSVT